MNATRLVRSFMAVSGSKSSLSRDAIYGLRRCVTAGHGLGFGATTGRSAVTYLLQLLQLQPGYVTSTRGGCVSRPI